MKIKSLYEKYEIMPQLVTHQLRVAGIVKLITDGWSERESAKRAVTACLIHDLGNIVKFDLSDEHQAKHNFGKVIDLKYWRGVQQKYRDQYGMDAHRATYGMLHAEGLEQYIEYLEREARLYKMKPRREDFLLAGKPAVMVLYADLRVGPKGVITMQERIQDLVERYGGERAESKWGGALEKYIQELTKVEVTKITERDVAPLFDELLAYEI